MSSKRMIRIEKKKKKMAALLEISKLNEHDRSKSIRLISELSNDIGLGPSAKRARTETDLECSEEYSEPKEEITISGKPKVYGDEFLQLKQLLREQTKKMRSEPKFRLREIGDNASLTQKIEDRIPLFLSDIQHLLLYSQIGHHSPYSPARWCHLEKFTKLNNTSVLIIENISLYHFQTYEVLFPFLSATFVHKLEVITPSAYKGDLVQDLATIPLTGTQVRKFIDQFGTLEEAVCKSPDLYDRIRDLFPLQKETISSGSMTDCSKDDKFPRTHLLLSGWQMVEENFPLPIMGLMETKYAGYVLTKDSYEEVTPLSPLFGVDCEMCRTTSGDLELTRISVVDENYEVVYEELVKPDNEISDYLTRFSGITRKMMQNVTKRLPDVQDDLRRILPADAILVGQSLGNDMHALKMMHPYVIDSSVIFNITGDRSRKTKLQTLAREFLNERIQEGRKGHCSIEDSIASLKLVKLKLANNIHFGDAVMANVASHVKHHPELGHPHFATSMLKQSTKVEKSAVVVGLEESASKYLYFTYKDQLVTSRKINIVPQKSNSNVVQTMCLLASSCSLNIGHLKINDNDLEKDPTSVYREIDKWVQEIYITTVTPGLCIVIMGGQQQWGNGCCFITIKKH